MIYHTIITRTQKDGSQKLQDYIQKKGGKIIISRWETEPNNKHLHAIIQLNDLYANKNLGYLCRIWFGNTAKLKRKELKTREYANNAFKYLTKKPKNDY